MFPSVIYITQLAAAGLGCTSNEPQCDIYHSYDTLCLAICPATEEAGFITTNMWVSRFFEYSMLCHLCRAFARALTVQHFNRAVSCSLAESLLETWTSWREGNIKFDWAVSIPVLDLRILNTDQSVSTRFKPLGTQVLWALAIRDLNPIDTSWSAFELLPNSQLSFRLHLSTLHLA